MPIQTAVTFHNMERSEAVENRVREKVQKLERFAGQITSCRVTVQAPHLRHAQGNLFDVRIDIHTPGAEIVVNREGGTKDPAHTDVYVAMRDAFAAATRQLESHIDRRHGR